MSIQNVISLLWLVPGLLLQAPAQAQLEGDQWVIGYWSGDDPNYSVMFFDFRDGQLNIKWQRELIIWMAETNASICDPTGEPLIWTNGMQIQGREGASIADTIAYEPVPDDPFNEYWNYYYLGFPVFMPKGFPKHDGALVLPIPESIYEYLVLYHLAENDPENFFAVFKHLEARIQYTGDTFKLMYKDNLVGYQHQWFSDNMEAVRHANGRDWWVVSFEKDSARYYAYLLDPSGLTLHHEGLTDVPVQHGLGQAAFSHDGRYLARMEAKRLSEGQFITLYAFDRCAGTLERLATFHTAAGYFTGVAFSPSDRYLYANDNFNLWQWDLWADDISASQTLVDTFDGFIDPGWFGTPFGPIVSAPDGRIYVTPPGGGSRYLHVIDRPDMPAAECTFLQHHISLQVWNRRSAPNIPNFRLGPLDGSPCDTLGIDNHPVSRWRFEPDAPDWLFTIRFTDLSYYAPDTWHWDFGDGHTSDEKHPVHTFEPGYYHVCLTVSNNNSTDSSCQWVEILTTSLHEERTKQPDLSIGPNPFTDELVIRSRSGHIRSAYLQLYDMHGRLVMHEPDAPVPVTIRMPSLLPGMYFCVIRDGDGVEVSAKLMKM